MYRLKTTAKSGYRVKPHIGVLQAGATGYVDVTILPHNQYHVFEDRSVQIHIFF